MNMYDVEIQKSLRNIYSKYNYQEDQYISTISAREIWFEI